MTVGLKADPPKTFQHTAATSKTCINEIAVESKITVENSDITIIAKISICNRPTKFLVDTGGHTTMIKSKCLKSNILYYPEIRFCLVGINGPNNTVKTHGAAYGNIVLGNIKLKQQFQIAGDQIYLNYDGILGLDFMTAYTSIINLRNMTITNFLPHWHELYEQNEREDFDKKWQQPFEQIQNKLIYKESNSNNFRDTTGGGESNIPATSRTMNNTVSKPEINDKKGSAAENYAYTLQTRINRFEILNLQGKVATNKIKIPPNGVRKFRIDAKNPVVCKAKTLENGVYLDNFIADNNHNEIVVHNPNDYTATIENLSIEYADIREYEVYKIKTNRQTKVCEERITKILEKLDAAHCTTEEIEIIKKLVYQYNDIFHVDGDGFTFAKNAEHKIYVKPGTNPINTKQYRIPHQQKEIVEEKIREMLENDIIEPSTSLWNSPLLLVPKKSSQDKKEYRFCVDYKI